MPVLGTKKNYILQLNNITEQDISLVGEEGLRQAALSSYNFPIPPTFVLTTLGFDDFITSANLVEEIVRVLSQVQPGDMPSAEYASKYIEELFVQQQYPSLLLKPLLQSYRDLTGGRNTFVVVTPSWVLGDQKVTTNMQDYSRFMVAGEDGLVLAIKQAWSTLFSAQAIYDRVLSGYTGPLTCSVIVQRMLQLEVSGTIWSFDSLEQHADMMLVKANYGLAASVIGKEVAQDLYWVDKSDLRVVEKRIAPQQQMQLLRAKPASDQMPTVTVPISEEWRTRQKLDDELVHKAAKIVKTLTDDFNIDLAVEFAIQAGDFYVLNVRELEPEQVAAVKSKPKNKSKHEDAILETSSETAKPLDFTSLVDEVEQLAQDYIDLTPDEDQAMAEPILDVAPELSLGKAIQNADKLTTKFVLNIESQMELPDGYAGITIDLQNLHDLNKTAIDLQGSAATDHQIQELVNNYANYMRSLVNAHPNQIVTIILGAAQADSVQMLNTEIIAYQYLAIKQVMRESSAVEWQFVLPPVLKQDEWIKLKTLLTHNGLRRSHTRKLGLHVVAQVMQSLVNDITNQDVDFLVLDWDRLLAGYTAGLNYDPEFTLINFAAYVQELIKLAHKHQIHVQILVNNQRHESTLNQIMTLAPQLVLLGNQLSKAELKQLENYTVEEQAKKLETKRGRKAKQI